ncbi:MAG: LruC domain-containing protein [Ferruginibacter sp.]|nr:LruC domain-containing protein [Cytophagales bacterium]
MNTSALMALFTSPKNLLWLSAMAALALSGCRKDWSESPGRTPPRVAPASPASFDFNTARPVEIHITGQDAFGSPLRMRNIALYTKEPAKGGTLITRGFTSPGGEFRAFIPLSKAHRDVYVQSNYVGVLEGAVVPIVGGRIRYDFRIRSAAGARVAEVCNDGITPYGPYAANVTASPVATGQDFNSGGTNGGKPCYVFNAGSPPAAFADDYNTQLPDGLTSTLGQRYVTLGKFNSDFRIVPQPAPFNTELQTVAITFLGEVASHRNALGYYYYPDADNPPTSLAAIQALGPRIVFPNSSLAGSGGQLLPGDRVTLVGPETDGQFRVGGALGWFIVPDGWDGTGDIRLPDRVFFSNAAFNPEPDTRVTTTVVATGETVTRSLKQHMANVNYPTQFPDYLGGRGGTVLGFEDLLNQPTRTESGDADFNDLLFYITPASNFTEVVAIPGVATDYPRGKGTLLYEDLWPTLGDFDMNDLVAAYEFDYSIYAAGTRVVDEVIQPLSEEEKAKDGDIQQIKVRIQFMALGGAYANGFAIQFPFPENAVQRFYATADDGVTPVPVPPFASQLGGEGLYTLVVSDNSYKSVGGFPAGNGPRVLNISNDASAPQYQFEPVNLVLVMRPGIKSIGTTNPSDSPIEGERLPPGAVPPFNPFITANGQTNAEVHLVGLQPTLRAATTAPFQFGGGKPTGGLPDNPGADDNTYGPEAGGGVVYYRSKPTARVPNTFWALNIDETADPTATGFRWPLEGVPITEAYEEFDEFTAGGATTNLDWYKRPRTPVNRYIYTK